MEDHASFERGRRKREKGQTLRVVDMRVREDRVGTAGDDDARLIEPLQQRARDDEKPPGNVPEPEVGERDGHGPPNAGVGPVTYIVSDVEPIEKR